MWEHGNRMILGLKGYAARNRVNYTGQQHRVINNRSKRRRYAELRAAGLTSYEAAGRLNGISGADFRAKTLAGLKRRNVRWGGAPNVGSQAWVNREVHKLATKLQAIGG